MILTYAEIADTAARKGERIVSPFVLAAGYIAGVARLCRSPRRSRNSRFTRAALLDSGMASASGLFSRRDLHRRRRLSILRAQARLPDAMPAARSRSSSRTGRPTPRGVFRLGVRQGLYCLGCCWAMMLVMFAVGVMNVIWMAALGMLMTIEKIGTGKRFSHAVGVALIAIGVAFVLVGVCRPLAAARDLS